MGDDVIGYEQSQNIIKKYFDFDISGSSNKGIKAIGGSVQARIPIVEQKVNLLIQGAGHYVDWGEGYHKGIDYRGVGLEISF